MKKLIEKLLGIQTLKILLIPGNEQIVRGTDLLKTFKGFPVFIFYSSVVTTWTIIDTGIPVKINKLKVYRD